MPGVAAICLHAYSALATSAHAMMFKKLAVVYQHHNKLVADQVLLKSV